MRRHSRRKNSTKIFALTAIFAAIIFAASNHFVNKSKEVVIAKVNGEKIFKSEIEAKLHNVFDGQRQEMQLPDIDSLPKEVIEILVKEIYFDKQLTKEAKKSKASKTEEIKAKINDTRDKIIRQAYIDSIIQAEVNDEAISEKYTELSNGLVGKKEYLISHIVVKNKEKAEEIAKELKSKKSSASKFSELAKKYSIDQESAENGGSLGYIVEDGIIKEIAAALVNLKKDEVSNPIETKFGWHLIKLSDVRDAKALPFESVKDNIRDQLIQEKISEINSRITKDIKIKILIKTKEVAAESEPVKTLEEEKQPEEIKKSEEVSSENLEKSEQPIPATEPTEIVLEKSDAKTVEKKSKHHKK
jgi:peptidyl-prolyl cis-trans isomerase C